MLTVVFGYLAHFNIYLY